jgi:hypothetical protein
MLFVFKIVGEKKPKTDNYYYFSTLVACQEKQKVILWQFV